MPRQFSNGPDKKSNVAKKEGPLAQRLAGMTLPYGGSKSRHANEAWTLQNVQKRARWTGGGNGTETKYSLPRRVGVGDRNARCQHGRDNLFHGARLILISFAL
jgi:hypothetical protein